VLSFAIVVEIVNDIVNGDGNGIVGGIKKDAFGVGIVSIARGKEVFGHGCCCHCWRHNKCLSMALTVWVVLEKTFGIAIVVIIFGARRKNSLLVLAFLLLSVAFKKEAIHLVNGIGIVDSV